MSDKKSLIQQINFALSDLSAKNAHHEFEHLSFHLARQRIASNLLPATGPVSAGGDQGRDFETFRTYIVGNVPENPLRTKGSGGKISFACTTQAERLPDKIKSDVTKTMTEGEPPEVIYEFIAQNVTKAVRSKLQKWARDTYGIDLEVLDRQAIACHLSDDDTFWIAERYLGIQPQLGLLAPTDSDQLATARHSYLESLASENQTADYRGVDGYTRLGSIVPLPLEDVYVQPQLLPYSSEESSEKTGRQRNTLTIAELLEKSRRAVVLGPAGSGKSTLVRFLALLCAPAMSKLKEQLGWQENLIPIVVSLAEFAEAQEDRRSPSLQAFIESKLIERGGKDLASALFEDLRGGRAFLILDGADEIPEASRRVGVTRAIEELVNRYSGNRLLLTSRQVGYYPLNIGDLGHFHIAPLDRWHIAEFVTRWKEARKVARDRTYPSQAIEREDAQRVLDEIQRNSSIAELATNPLMLVILLLISDTAGSLPERRVELFERAVNTLLNTWADWRSPVPPRTPAFALPNQIQLPVWCKVAEWIQLTRPVQFVRRADLKRKVVEILASMSLGTIRVDEAADQCLEAMVHRAGILEEHGPDAVKFWHASLQEFLAGRSLASDMPAALARVLHHREEDRWRAAIRFCVGYLSLIARDLQTASTTVEAIAYSDPGPLEPLFHSNLVLATRCIADNTELDDALEENLLRDLIDVVKRQPYPPFTTALASAVRFSKALPRPDQLTILISLAEHAPEGVSSGAAHLLSNAAQRQPLALQACKGLLKSGYSTTRTISALALVRAGVQEREAWEILLSCLAEHASSWEFLTGPELGEYEGHLLQLPNIEYRLKFSQRFLSGNAMTQRIKENLIQIAERGSTNQRFEAATLLHGAGLEFELVTDTIKACSESTDFWHYLEAAELLEKIGQPEARLKALLSLVQVGDCDEVVPAAKELLKLEYEEQAIEALAACAMPQENRYDVYYLRFSLEAVELLIQLRPTHERIVPSLRALAATHNDEIAFIAAVTLVDIGATDQTSLDCLAGCITYYAEDSRGGLEPSAASERLIKLLRGWLNSNDFALRSGAAELLIEIDQVDDLVVDALISCIQPIEPEPDPDDGGPLEWDWRYRALDLLIELRVGDQRIVQRIDLWLASDNFPVQLGIAELLIRQNYAKGSAMTFLHQSLTTGEPKERLAAASLLIGREERVDDTIVNALRSCIQAGGCEDDLIELVLRIARTTTLDQHFIDWVKQCLYLEPRISIKAAKLLEQTGHLDPTDLEALSACLESTAWSEAARLLIRNGCRAGWLKTGLLQRLRSESDYRSEHRLNESFQLFMDFAQMEPEAIEELVPLLGPTPMGSVECLKLLLDHQSLDRRAAVILAEMVSFRPEEESHRKALKQALFNIIGTRINPGDGGGENRN